MKKRIVALLALCLLGGGAYAQKSDVIPELPVPHKISAIEMQDLNEQVAQLPGFGEKDLLIFYIDPDKHKQNEDFTFEIEENGKASGPNIMGYGIINLKDTRFPKGIVRSMARKRTAKNGATVLVDPDRRLANKWSLGDCNNMFVLLVVSKQGELVFCKKGELSAADKAEFYEMIKNYR